MLRYLQSWIDRLRWQRLKPMAKLERMLLDHLEGILIYCRTKVPMGLIETVNGNIKALLRRGRGYRDMNYLLLKAQRLAASKTEFLVFRKPHNMRIYPGSCSEPKKDGKRPGQKAAHDTDFIIYLRARSLLRGNEQQRLSIRGKVLAAREVLSTKEH